LESINIGTAGHFELADPSAEGGPQLEPLLTSSERAALMPAVRFQFLSDPGELLYDFMPTGERYALAARLSGPISTAFPDGPPSEESDSESDGGEDGAEAADAAGGDEATGSERDGDAEPKHLAS